ncbi:MAG: restriction endonuclease subunit S [Nanoarchaeota archaeon]|nr:restriction endonuclease subunit S [Nanoarchaeota archaeon]MBU1988548.1 restriction endonuclease subunit S [Nanoarchaeota archaeon]
MEPQIKQLPGGWKKITLKEVLDYEQPNPYIIETPIIGDDKLTPVLTPGKSFIKGYTKETDGIYNTLPVIIFDDFTTSSKFVNFPFKVKSSAMKILKTKDDKIPIKFIFYQMDLFSLNTTTHKRQYLSEYQNLEFAFPVKSNGSIDIEKQQLIVDEVEKQLTRLENSIESLKKVKKKIGTYRKAILKKAFEKKEDWERYFISDMGIIVTGKTPKTSIAEYYGDRYCFFKPGDLNGGYYINDSVTKLSDEGINLLKKLPEKSIMVTCIGATIGKTGLNRVEGATNQQINSIIVNQLKFIPEFLYYLFISDLAQREIIGKSSSTTLPILNKGKFEKLNFILPNSKEEQQKIVSEIESKFSVIDNVEKVVDAVLIKSEQLRKSILKIAFEGGLVQYEKL